MRLSAFSMLIMVALTVCGFFWERREVEIAQESISNMLGDGRIQKTTKKMPVEKEKQKEKSLTVYNSPFLKNEFELSMLPAVSIKKPDPRKLKFPAMEDILSDDKRSGASDEGNIIGDVDFLLDVAILGHAKCATSFIMKWLHAHPQIKIWKEEVCDLYDQRPAQLSRKLYTDFPPTGDEQVDRDTLRGFKCPGHFSRPTIRYFRRYFGQAKVIIGVRHPVSFFQSYYNFRARHPKLRLNATLPDANELIGECTEAGQGLCTDRAKFHSNLAMFGKTNMTDDKAFDLLHLDEKYRYIVPVENEVFLYDLAQLYDSDASRVDQVKLDLQNFLGLKTPLIDPDGVRIRDPAKKMKQALDICEDRYAELRAVLLKIGKRASMWIRHYFIKSPEVTVSNMAHFEAILKEWEIDPCSSKELRRRHF